MIFPNDDPSGRIELLEFEVKELKANITTIRKILELNRVAIDVLTSRAECEKAARIAGKSQQN